MNPLKGSNHLIFSEKLNLAILNVLSWFVLRILLTGVVQRLPEYVDSKTDPTNNEPWDEGATLNTMNQAFGRRFEIQSFRWLDDSEV